jgi:hypothetical protein
VKKTSLYLHETDVQRLRRLAQPEGRSQADIVRTAIGRYEAAASRHFALAGAWAGDGTSVADIREEELLEGFGQ